MKIGIEELVSRFSKKLITPIGHKGINQELGSELNSRVTSEILIPALEGQTKTVN